MVECKDITFDITKEGNFPTLTIHWGDNLKVKADEYYQGQVMGAYYNGADTIIVLADRPGVKIEIACKNIQEVEWIDD